jgi:hypothetical protein
VRLKVPAVLLAAAAALPGCGAWDWFPPERLARSLFNGWDGWDTVSVQPYQQPMPQVPEGAVPFGGSPDFAEVTAQFEALPASTRQADAPVAWRRYCYPCHGPNGDGRIIVGESFSPAPPDLRSERVQALSDERIYEQVRGGSANMIPLADTLTPLETLLAVDHLRSLSGHPSEPFFTPKDTRPLE